MADLIDEVRGALPQSFRVDGLLDGGGQGSVFRGAINATPAAIKVFSQHVDPKRIERELSLLQTISCPHLVRLLGRTSITLAGAAHTVVAYELHGGGDLRALLAPAAPALSAGNLAQLGSQVGSAVDALWAKRIVHRDIKPANIVRADDGRFVLVDVGIARHVDLTSVTAAGMTVGTPGFMSPEQAAGRRALTVHSDSFSLGITLYVLATRRHPWGNNQALVGRSLFQRLGGLRTDLPPPLARLVDSMLSPAPSQRPSQLAQAFSQFAGIP